MKIWIDLDNSPHVPLFAPIAKELEARGHSVVFTARDCFQVCGLADLMGLQYERIGRHYGKNPVLKLAGMVMRSVQLAPIALRQKPDLAISHGSRSQLLLATMLRIPSILMMDYEFVRALVFMRPNWIMVPELMPDSALKFDPSCILRYPGIKEDVYAPSFQPDPKILTELNLTRNDLIVVLRPPAQQAHYHVAESDDLFHAALEYIGSQSNVRVVLLPRNEQQGVWIRKQWPELFRSGRMMIPDRAVDGLNLIWHADLVISGGGTMNREAAALGVPVYSIFRGQIGAVDRYLADSGRLTLVESQNDVHSKIRLQKRVRRDRFENGSRNALTAIVDQVTRSVGASWKVPQYSVR